MEGINSLPLNPNTTDKLRIQPYFPKTGDFRDNHVRDSCPRFLQKNYNIPRPDWNSKMKMKIPYALPPPANPRFSQSLDKAIEYELKHGRRLDPNMDKKKLRRTISNRLSAQRSRIKKAQYISKMEKMVNDLEELISVLTPQIESYKEKRKQLLLQNDSLQNLVELHSNEAKLREIELEQKRVEVCRLKDLEKTTNKNNEDSDSWSQQMQDFSLKQIEKQPYLSLGFCQNGLQHLQKLWPNQFCQQQLLSSAVVLQAGLKMAPNSGLQKTGKDGLRCSKSWEPIEVWSAPEKNKEEAEIDEYLNFEAVNVDAASV
ncbi:Basic leucine zipper 6 [Sesamum alatum]|uniref:Basic leucine zipper 6 n=1 Tax=Sesamum alatum TaxID=300844 RepID=A0AAE1XIV3_9LAMI|nr:Basic leucine zipper 6 [Sesamum alatum]